MGILLPDQIRIVVFYFELSKRSWIQAKSGEQCDLSIENVLVQCQ